MGCGALLQNSIDSIYAVPEAFMYLVARLDHSIVSYGIIDKKQVIFNTCNQYGSSSKPMEDFLVNNQALSMMLARTKCS